MANNGRVMSLAEEVLPLIRTRADLHRWSAANAHGSTMHDAIDLLESELHTVDPAEAYTVTHQALASAIKVIARADDSSGVIGDACRRLLELHPWVAADAHVPPAKLVKWMMKFQFDGEVDFFELDPVAYAPALGEPGLRTYRARLDEIRAALPPKPDADTWRDPSSHARWVLDWNDRRLALLDRDIEAIIRTHARDRRVAAWLQDTAEAFAEINEFDLAIDWAQQATDFSPGHQSQHAAEYWCELLAEHRPAELLNARLTVFRKWPSSSTATRLHTLAAEAWPSLAAEVTDTLSAHPAEAVTFTLDTLRDPGLAWQLAHDLNLTNDDVWHKLASAYETIDPGAALAIHQRLVDQLLVETNVRNYRYAARSLAHMRTLAARSGKAAEIDAFIAGLRDTYRRRPRMLQEFDRARLP